MSEQIVKKVILQKVRDHIIDTQTAEVIDIAKIIGCDIDDEVTLDAYQDALRAYYPEDFPEPEPEEQYEPEPEPEPEPAPAPKPKSRPTPAPAAPPAAPDEFKLLDGSFLKPLEVVRQKGNLLILQVVRPPEPDPVTIRVKGQDVTVDLTALRARPQDQLDGETGLKVSALVMLAELAKG